MNTRARYWRTIQGPIDNPRIDKLTAAILAITSPATENGTEELGRLQRYHSVHPLYSNKQYFMTSHSRIENK